MSDTTPPAGGQVPPPAAPAPAAPYTPAEDQNMAAWAHLSTIIPIATLIIWLVGKDRGPKTNVEGKEALNFAITFVIYLVGFWIVSAIIEIIPILGFIWLVTLGWIVPLAIWVLVIVLAIQGFQRVNQGGSFRYPDWVNFRFIK